MKDDNFLNALREQVVDKNGDHLISLDEAEALTYLDLIFKNITELTGIEMFISLDSLGYKNILLTCLDVSKLTKQSDSDCHGNQLTSLSVSKNTIETDIVAMD